MFHRQTLNPVSCSNLRGFVQLELISAKKGGREQEKLKTVGVDWPGSCCIGAGARNCGGALANGYSAS